LRPHNLCLTVEFSGNAMHRSNKCATPATHDTGTQAAQGLGNCKVIISDASQGMVRIGIYILLDIDSVDG